MNENTRNKLPLPARVTQDGLFLLGLQQLISKALISPSRSPPPTPIDNRCESPLDVTSNTSRKRKKNSNLSEAEKRQKRMVMNRVAAQNAREKKRQYVEDLERKLSQLETQNKLLAAENRILKAEASRLALETVKGTNMMSMDAQDSSRSPGSAAPQVSQQKKQALRALFLQTWMAVSCLTWLLESNGLKQHCLQATLLPQMAYHMKSGSPLNHHHHHLILTLRASWVAMPPPHLKEPP